KGLVLRGSVLRTALLFANIAVALYMMPFVIHAIGDRWYGMWTLIGTFMGYYGYLDFGLSVAVQRFIAGAIGRRDDQEINRLFTTSLVILALLATLAVAVTFTIGVLAPRFFTDPAEISVFRWVLLLLGINITVTLLMAPVNGIMTGNLRYDLATYIDLTKLAVRTVLILYFIGAGYSIVALAFITLITDVGGNAVKILAVRRMFRGLRVGRAHFAAAQLRPLFGYGGKAFVNQLADLMRFQIDHLVIAAFINLSAVTLFNIAGQLVYYFRMLIGALLGVLIPVYARYQATNDREAVFRTYYFVSKLAAVIAVIVGGAALNFGREFVVLWMGPGYVDAYGILVLLIVPTMLYATQQPSQSLIYGLGAVGTLARVSIVEAAANVLLSLALVGPYGLTGVALGTAVPLTFYALFLMVFSSRLAGGSVATYLRRVGPVLLLGVAVQVVTALALHELVLDSWSALITTAAIALSIQGLVMLFLGFSERELRLIWDTGLKALGLAGGVGR
ncbi:MAG TPA: oligosaccharide flippase family protein, partial [Acidiferrobacterales bacterium]